MNGLLARKELGKSRFKVQVFQLKTEVIINFLCLESRQAMADVSDTYIDFLVLGKTGMGKSTTADRLLVADSVPGASDVIPVEKEGGNTQLDDILIWRLNGRSVGDVKGRVKFFLVNRAAGITGIDAVDPNNKSPDSVTKDCVLLSNEKTRIRVLDVPGFYSTLSSHQAAAQQVANQDNLGIMRQILRIQAVKQLHFRRILYFLPFRGVCERADRNFQEELKVMYHYFGRVIFDSMIVIATERPRKSTSDAFNDEDASEVQIVLKRTFQLALAAPNQNPDEIRDIPQPPIYYLSLEESNSDIIDKLRQKKVAREGGLQLQLHENTCARCSLKFGVHRIATVVEPVVSIGQNDGERSAYDQSMCHPLITLKYSKIQKFVGGVAYILLLGIPLLAGKPWPGFFNHDEECVKCKNPPGSPGCTLLGEEWVMAGNKIKVDHDSELDQVHIVVQP